MNAKDFRIGNLIYSKELNLSNGVYEKKIIEVDYHVLFDLIKNSNSQKYSPILPTEELLAKLGFKQVENIGFRKFFGIGNFVVEFSEGGMVIYYTKGELISYKKYIHEIQNLFHALTDEELKFE